MGRDEEGRAVLLMVIRCNCCKRDYSPNSRPFVGKIIYGWLSEYAEKLITEGKPVAIAFCDDCIRSGKVEIPAWSSFVIPIHVKSNNTSFIVDFVGADDAIMPVKPQVKPSDAAMIPDGHKPIDALADAQRSDQQPVTSASIGASAPPATPAQPEAKKPKPAAPIPAGVCSKCGNEIDAGSLSESKYIHGIALCKECNEVETARVIKIMRDNESAGKPLTNGLEGSTKAVAFCTECGGIVNENDRKASRLFFNTSLCKHCFIKEKTRRQQEGYDRARKDRQAAEEKVT